MLMLYIIVLFDMKLEQMNVNTVFLHRNLKEQVSMELLEGFAKRVLKTKYVCCINQFIV